MIPAPETNAASPFQGHPRVKPWLDQAVTAFKEVKQITDRFEGKEIPSDQAEAIKRGLAAYKEHKARADQEAELLAIESETKAPAPKFPVAGAEGKGETPEQKAAARAAKWETIRRVISHGPQAVEQKALSAIVDTSGALLIPRETSDEILTEAPDTTFMLTRSYVIRSNASGIDIPVFAGKNRAQGTPVKEEGGTPSQANYASAWGTQRLTPHPRQIEVQVPVDLINDAEFDIEGFIREQVSMDLGNAMEDDFLNGSGVQRPKGIFAVTISQQFNSGVAGATVKPEDIRKAPLRIPRSYRRDSIYAMPNALVEQVMLMRDDSGGAGTGQFLWQPSFQAGQPALLNGYPQEEADYWPSIAAVGSPLFLFGNFRRGYWIQIKRDITFKRLVELEARARMVVILAEVSADGAPVRTEAFTRCNRI